MEQGSLGDADLRSIARSIESINERLDRIEASLSVSDSVVDSPPEHPSKDRFSIAEAIADSIFGREYKEKACTFEPNGKPCDHCSMCSSRGF